MSILGLIAAFGGGIFGAAIGGMPSFILAGTIAMIGSILSCAGITGISELMVNNLAFGPFLAPPVAFLGGVAASAYAASKGKTENGADVATALNVLASPDVLFVGGIFGMIGYVVSSVAGMVFGPIIPFATDNGGFAVFWVGIVVRFVFGKRGLLSAPEKRSVLSKDGVLGNTILISLGYSIAVSGVYCMLAPTYADQLNSYHFIIFGLAALGLIFAEFGQAFFGWHHIGIISAEAVMAGYGATGNVGTAMIMGIIFGVVAGIIGDFAGCYINTDVDTHIDPPACAIWILTIVINVVAFLL